MLYKEVHRSDRIYESQGQFEGQLGVLECISCYPAYKGGHAEPVEWPLFKITNRAWAKLSPDNTEHTNLMSCGMGRVLSRPRATNPRIETKTSERPKIKNKMAKHSLCQASVIFTEENIVLPTWIQQEIQYIECTSATARTKKVVSYG